MLFDIVQAGHGKQEPTASGRALTIADIQDRAMEDNPDASLFPTSPRSVAACLRLGIDPSALRYIPYERFFNKYRRHDLAKVAFEHYESSRSKKFAALEEERSAVGQEEGGTPMVGCDGMREPKVGLGWKTDSHGLIEREMKRLEVLRRRQERDMGQIKKFEQTRLAMQQAADAKVQELERRIAAREASRRAAATEAAAKRSQKHLLKELVSVFLCFPVRGHGLPESYHAYGLTSSYFR